ncbi:MAG: hypothetical protein HC810_02750 [Acaryochloridaceae cyanobacterium RL_2_7]|nr:hypothetical protein [Acaryochloridaceae cyanobacterium RL_2_7]
MGAYSQASTFTHTMSQQDYQRSHLQQVQGYQPSAALPYRDDIIKLNSNENPYPPSPKVIEVLKNIHPDYLRRYQDPEGTAFKERVAQLHGITPPGFALEMEPITC